jgi:hypothetical protein
MNKRKRTKGETAIYNKTLRIKQKIDLHELHYKLGVNSSVLEGYAFPGEHLSYYSYYKPSDRSYMGKGPDCGYGKWNI